MNYRVIIFVPIKNNDDEFDCFSTIYADFQSYSHAVIFFDQMKKMHDKSNYRIELCATNRALLKIFEGGKND